VALLGAHHILHFSRIRVKVKTAFATYGAEIWTLLEVE
jgi:hypothetical protein